MSEGDSGWIRLYRDLLNKPIWTVSTTEQKVIMITLLLMANHEDKEWEWKGKKFKCKKGQFITSLDRIVEKTGKCVTIQNVRTALVRFEKYEFLTNESTKTGRLITICNWDYYQQIKEMPNIDTDKDLTKSQQRANKELTPNKNDKNYNNNNNNTIKEKDKKEKVYVLPNDEFSEIVKEWLEYKKDRRESYKSEKSILTFVTKLKEKSGGDPVVAKEIIDQSIMNNWAGIFNLKDKKAVKPISTATYYKNSNIENDDRF